MLSVSQIPKRMFSSCLASVAVMPLQAVELLMTGLARAALPGLPYPGGCRRAPPPVRLLLTSPAGTSAATLVAPKITFDLPSHSHFRRTLPLTFTKTPRALGNSRVALNAPTPSARSEPALSKNRYEALLGQNLCNLPYIHWQEPILHRSNAVSGWVLFCRCRHDAQILACMKRAVGLLDECAYSHR